MPRMPKRWQYSYTAAAPPVLWRGYTYFFPWVKTEETILASLDLSAESQLYLTTAFLVWTRTRAREQRFARSQIAALLPVHQRFWLPLIVGGIVAPFALILTTTHWLPLWWGIGVSLGALLLAFYGWQGQERLLLRLHDGRTWLLPMEVSAVSVRHFLAQLD